MSFLNKSNKHFILYKKFKKNLIFKTYKPLLKKTKNYAGRNYSGSITVYNKKGRNRRLYKNICFNYIVFLYYKKYLNVLNWIIQDIQYDCFRTSYVALLKNYFLTDKINKKYIHNYYSYILANKNMKKGQFINFFDKFYHEKILDNQWTKLANLPCGSKFYNLEIKNKKATIARSAGVFCTLLRKQKKICYASLPSGKIIKLNYNCYVSVGQVSNYMHRERTFYKAGNSYKIGKRPKVRGVAKNPVDHPHGGGEGKSSGGRHPVNKRGILTKGFVTKKNKKKYKKKNG